MTLWITVYITWECAYRVISKWCHSAAFGTDFSDIVDLSFSVGRLYAACILNETFLEIGVNVEWSWFSFLCRVKNFSYFVVINFYRQYTKRVTKKKKKKYNTIKFSRWWFLIKYCINKIYFKWIIQHVTWNIVDS